MKKIMLIAILLISSAPILFSDGIGIYVPDRNGYRTQDGSSYSFEDNTCASNIYTQGSILSIKSDDGSDVLVYVNDIAEMPPDRKILLNTKAANELKIADKGFDNREVSIVLDGEDEKSATGWSKFKIAVFETNKDALDAYRLLTASGFKATAAPVENGVELYVRYIPQYQVSTVGNVLNGMGYSNIILMAEENPYS